MITNGQNRKVGSCDLGGRNEREGLRKIWERLEFARKGQFNQGKDEIY
jgi:hypothetical protein